MPTLFLTATCSEPSLRSSGARYNFSKSSSFFSELARAIRISTLPTRASSLASAVCASAMLEICSECVLRQSGGQCHGGVITRYLRRAPQADANGVAHQLLGTMAKQANRGGWVMFGARHAFSVWCRPVIAFTRRRHQAGIRWTCASMTQYRLPVTIASRLRFASVNVDNLTSALLPELDADYIIFASDHAFLPHSPEDPPEASHFCSEHAKRHSEPLHRFVQPQSTITPSTHLVS